MTMLDTVLPEFQDYLLVHKLAPEKDVPFYALWAQRFLAFIKYRSSSDRDILARDFLFALAAEKGVADWQVCQAEEALKLYIDHFKKGQRLKEV